MSKTEALNHHHYFDPRRFHPDMEYHAPGLVALGLTLTFLFLHFSLWNRLGRSRAPKDVLLLYEEAFPWLVLITVLNLVLLLLELGFWTWLWDLKESRWPRARNPGPLGRAWGSLSRLWGGLLRTPMNWTHWLSTQFPESLVNWLLQRSSRPWFGILTMIRLSRLWPMLVPALVLNLEVHGSGVIRYFYWSLALSLIPLGSRLYLALIETLGLSLKIQKFRRHQKIRILDSAPELGGTLVQILELIPRDQQQSFLNQWSASHFYTRRAFYWSFFYKLIGSRIRILRYALLLLAWGSVLLWPLLAC